MSHCFVIGTCLTTGELRKIVKRAVLQTTAAAVFVTLGTLQASRAMTHIPNGADADGSAVLVVATLGQDDPGVFSINGPYGTGWHHFSTDDDQIFAHYPGELHFYVFDFGVTERGNALHLGNDIITTFDANLDKMCFLNSQTGDGSYTVSSSVSWNGAPGHTGSSADVTFYAVDAMMNFSELGTLAIERWVRKKGEKMRGSQWQDRFMPVQGCS